MADLEANATFLDDLDEQASYLLPDPAFGPGDRMTPNAHHDLCLKLHGTRRRPGLQARPDLRFTVELGWLDDRSEARALQLRQALLACGVAPAQIELNEVESYSLGLRVRHAIDAG